MADNWWQSLSFNSCSLQVMKILEIICGSSRQRYSVKKGVVKNFAKFTGKNLLTKRFWHRRFPVNFVKFLRTPFLTEHLRWLLLYLPGGSPNQEFSIYKLTLIIRLSLIRFLNESSALVSVA